MGGTAIILGAPFTGTTLMAFLLGEHPDVTNVGEYACRYCDGYPGGPEYQHEYFSSTPLGKITPARTACRFCGDWCGVWQLVPRHYPPHNIYSRLRGYLGAPWIVDVSKAGAWYQAAISTEDNPEIVCVMVHKPVWGHVGSQARYKGLDINRAPRKFLEEHAAYWVNWHRTFKDLVAKHPSVMVAYEDLCSDARTVTHRVWRKMGLQYPPELPTCKSTDWRRQHPIDGNYKLCQKIKDGERVQIRFDPQTAAAGKDARAAMMAVPEVKETMEWLGRYEAVA